MAEGPPFSRHGFSNKQRCSQQMQAREFQLVLSTKGWTAVYDRCIPVDLVHRMQDEWVSLGFVEGSAGANCICAAAMT